MRPWYYAAIAGCIMLAAAPSSMTGITPAAAQAGGGPVCVFEHVNFSGRQLCFGPGQSIPIIRSYGDFWNDRISSIAVAPGFVVRACQHDGFQGALL